MALQIVVHLVPFNFFMRHVWNVIRVYQLQIELTEHSLGRYTGVLKYYNSNSMLGKKKVMKTKDLSIKGSFRSPLQR